MTPAVRLPRRNTFSVGAALARAGGLAALVLCSCANQQSPQGGPIDVTPPQVLATDPPKNTVNFRGNRITVEMDKYVDQRSFEESVFISPYVGSLEFDWSGKEVEIAFSEALRLNTTYVVNIGTDVVDLNNRNRMANAFVLAFSTGPDIDHGAIEGRVFPRSPDDPVSGVMIFAYRLDGTNPDTLNPQTLRPGFITQTGSAGAFFLHHIPFGAYRVYAVRDQYRNLLYDPEADDFGVQSMPVFLSPSDTLVAGLFMQLSKEDTTAPRLVRAEAVGENHVLLTFSEPVAADTIGAGAFSVFDTLARASLAVRGMFCPIGRADAVELVTGTQDSTAYYRVFARGIRDSSGNRLSAIANSAVFQGSGRRDTLATRLVAISIPDSSITVSLDENIRISFSDAIALPDPSAIADLRDSRGVQVPTIVRKKDDARVELEPHALLTPASWYRLTVHLRGIKDWAGKGVRDSIRVMHFRTFDPEDRSSIEGAVRDSRGPDRGSGYVIHARRIGTNETTEYTATTDSAGRFLFQNILDGRYVLQAFFDVDRNGRYDAGRPFPFLPSEPLSLPTDTLKVRARWPLEGVTVRFP